MLCELCIRRIEQYALEEQAYLHGQEGSYRAQVYIEAPCHQQKSM
jgi:hypothetical protein